MCGVARVLQDAIPERLEETAGRRRMFTWRCERQQRQRLRPPPRQLPTGGVMLHRYTLRGGDRYFAASPEKLLEDPVSSVARLPPGYRHLLPAPLSGREEAAERAGRWGWSMKEVYQRMQRQGGGCSIPLPAGPTTGRFSIDTLPRRRSPHQSSPWHGIPPDLVERPVVGVAGERRCS